MFLFPRRVFCSEEKDCDGVSEQRSGGSERRIPRRAKEKGGDGNQRLRAGEAKRASAEDVVPIVERRPQKLNGGMKANHGVSHGLARGVVKGSVLTIDNRNVESG